jgi:hypothetical protein
MAHAKETQAPMVSSLSRALLWFGFKLVLTLLIMAKVMFSGPHRIARLAGAAQQELSS